MLTGEQRIIELLVAIHPGATGIALRGQMRLRVQFRGLFSAGVSMVGGEGFLQDLSHYGCRMESDTSLPPGTELELCFFYGHGRPCQSGSSSPRYGGPTVRNSG
jgi:hypothetical protein